MRKRYFRYTAGQMEALKGKDARLGAVIGRLGKIRRETEPDFFKALAFSVVGQQISTKAADAICGRLADRIKPFDANTLLRAKETVLSDAGVSPRKIAYLKDLSAKIVSKAIDPESLKSLSDDEAIRAMATIKGVGEWTAEMVLLFCFNRMNVLSRGDRGIRLGLTRLYGHKEITPGLHARYFRRFSPLCSVASLYLWEVAAGK